MAGDYAEGERRLQRVLKVRVARLGAEHPHALASAHVLARLYVRQGRTAHAYPLVMRVLQQRSKLHGPMPFVTLAARQTLAELLCLEQRVSAAEVLLNDAIRISKQQPGDNHPVTLDLLAVYSQMNLATGSYVELTKLF